MIYIKQLTDEETITLKEMHKYHPLHLSRKRAHALLLSHQGMSVPMICSTYSVCRQTVSTWFSKWETQGICGLVDESGRGRHSLLTDHQKNAVVARVEKSPRSLKTVLSEIEAEFGVALSIDTLKLICKQAGLVWKRVRKSLRKKRNQEEFDRSKEKIGGESLFLRKLVLGIPAQASGKNLTRPLMPSAPQTSCVRATSPLSS